MSMLRQSNIKKRKSARVKWCVQEFCCCFFLFLRTCHWCEVVFVLHSQWLGTSLSGTIQVIYSGHLTRGGTRLHLFFFSFWLSAFILHEGRTTWGRTGGEKLKGKRMCNRRWKSKSPVNCIQHKTCCRRLFGGWWAREPHTLFLQPPVPLQQTAGVHGSCRSLWPRSVCHMWAVSWLAACLPWLPLLKARCFQTWEDEGSQGTVGKSWECRYAVLPWAGLHLCFLAALCI